jgi:hypothetical protein
MSRCLCQGIDQASCLAHLNFMLTVGSTSMNNKILNTHAPNRAGKGLWAGLPPEQARLRWGLF